ncbi:uncharacterized protein BJX67DRAFT_388910 [Aspergillus lucknowensis]|uniref:Hpc2-related domain-containing protein n=1 Tax=Aspergillus lucknowensis TaxID=176173 RepID=A0ABR4LN76_9EURO
MSTEPPVWSAQDEHELRSPVETRPRRSRRKKDDDADTADRKEPAKSARSKDKEKEKEKDREREKDKENQKKEEMDHEKKESKRPSRRQREKSFSASNNTVPAPTQATVSHARKKPKLEPTPLDQSPNSSPADPAAASRAPASASTPVPAPARSPAPPTAPIPAPKLSPLDTSAPISASNPQQPPQPPIQQTRPLHPPSQVLSPSHQPPPASSTAATSSPYPTVVSAPPSRPQSQPLAPPPQRSSGQNYDPIRSAFDTIAATPASSTAPVSASFSPPPRPVSPRPFRASASPAISSIIDPPQNTSPRQYTSHPYGSPGRSASSYPPTPAPPAIAPTHLQVSPSSSQFRHQSPYGPPLPTQPSQESHLQTRLVSSQPQVPGTVTEPQPPATYSQQTTPAPMEVDSERPAPVVAEKAPKKESMPPSTAPSSKPPSPKPSRPAKEAPPPLPQGSGLISNALFGGVDDSASETSTKRTPNIIVHIPLQGNGNKIINFARLAEEQYGFAALYPQVAARQERMARVAAAGAALERNDRSGRGISAGESADEDLSLEVDRDSELEGGGALSAAAAQTSEPADGKKRRRRKKVEEYDRDDPFVDDSEMVWQEQAAASKDGFFVYSGPLVAEGEKVQVERADGTIKRGRGRGRGGRSRAPATTHQQLPLAAAIPISEHTGLPVRGPGSRGGNINRRPRVSKKAEQDKTNGPTSVSQGRGGGGSGRGGSASSRGGKASMVELAPRPNLAPAPPGLNPMAGPEIAMK